MTRSTPIVATYRIGVFDSGVGGLTVLAALRRRLPDAALLYAADSAYAPYGERDAAYVRARSERLTRFLLGQGAQMIVVACNTATALAIAPLRRAWPHIPFVGIEPAIKPALAASSPGAPPVAVLATPGTLASAKFRALIASHDPAGRLLLQPCPGLAETIENRGPHAPETASLVRRLCAPLRAAGCTTVVLGCTHYPLAAHEIRAALGDAGEAAILLDPAQAVAEQAARLASRLPAPEGAAPAELRAWSNGVPALLQRIAQACALGPLDVQPLPDDSVPIASTS